VNKNNQKQKIAVIGNPNSGKSSLFNLLTGLNQKTGNYPGVTVDLKTGTFHHQSNIAQLIDLPGIYSLVGKSIDEKVSVDVLLEKTNPYHPDKIIMVADATMLKRSLFLTTQLIDLKIPIVLAVNMIDLLDNPESIDFKALERILGIPVVAISANKNTGIKNLEEVIFSDIKIGNFGFFDSRFLHESGCDSYESFLMEATHQNFNSGITSNAVLTDAVKDDSINRYNHINQILKEINLNQAHTKSYLFTKKLDKIFTHTYFGTLIFLFILFIVFQAVFTLAEWPMNLIEDSFSFINQYFKNILPAGLVSDLITDGLITGIGSVMVFVPQIAFLFAFLLLMEDTGYMARAVFLLDRLLRRFGLNGRSVIPLISGAACAIPAIMSTRTISNWKERMITILVTPLITCSARLPVFTLIIAAVIPDTKYFFVSLQGLMLLGFYLLGFVAALATAWFLKIVMSSRERSFFVMEMPIYRWPSFRPYAINLFEKIKVFVIEAGKIIVLVSIIIFVLSSFGPKNRFAEIEEKAQIKIENGIISEADAALYIANEKLKNSYAGIIGKSIEPIIEPLGFDWKMGIALITSFAAREVYVSTMATLYSVAGAEENPTQLVAQMRAEVNEKTGKPLYNIASGIALMLFYAFALQCMSTVAVVYRETKSYKWPAIQFGYMMVLAYISAFIAYQIF
jgi:ferrous iron transport protein B